MLSIDWEILDEAAIDSKVHDECREFLSTVFPDGQPAFDVGVSWVGARPERRILGWSDGALIAHSALLGRSVRVGYEEAGRAEFVRVPVVDVGLLGIARAYRGTGAGRELVARTMNAIDEEAPTFGFFNAKDSLSSFYESCGWIRIREAKRMRYLRGFRPGVTWTGEYPVFVYPAGKGGEDWPRGDLTVVDGIEL